MGVERLEGETPRFRVEPDPLQRAQAIAERDQMRALRTVRPEHRGGKQNGAAGVAGVRRLLQRAEQTGRRQIAVVGLRRLGGKVPERDRHLLAKRIERGDEPLQQGAWQPGFERDVHACRRARLRARSLKGSRRRQQQLPAAHPVAGLLGQIPGGLVVAGKRRDAHARLGETCGLHIASLA